MTARIIEWRTPSEPTRGPKAGIHDEAYEAVARDLRLNPERWALIATNSNVNLAEGIKKGRNRFFRPAGSFEATVRGTKRHDGKIVASEIFARYVGK